MLYRAPLVQPKDVAWLLASYAREARARAEDHPLASFGAVKKALQESLGIRFEGEKGEHFLRSTLVQTLFYGTFSVWVLWRHAPEGRAPAPVFNRRTIAWQNRDPGQSNSGCDELFAPNCLRSPDGPVFPRTFRDAFSTLPFREHRRSDE